MLEWLHQLHSAAGISQIIQTGGLIALPLILFAETGLLVGFFLPGDSLLITAGVLANPANPNHIPSLDVLAMNFILVLAVILGDQTAFFLGRKAGNSMWDRPDGRLYKRKHLEAAHDFYKSYGGFSVVAARYMPIVRTFVPFVSGLARMPYRNYVFWSVGGGALWITSLLWIGFYLGQTTLANRLDKVIVVVLLVSVLPMVVGVVRKWLKKKSAVAA